MKRQKYNSIKILYGYDPERIDEQVLFTMLKQNSYIIQPATNNQEILNGIQNEKIDIALISNQIKYIDPYEACYQIAKKHAIPVFMIVLSHESVDILKAFAKGVSDFIISPYIPPLVFARIENYHRMNKLEKLCGSKAIPKILQNNSNLEPQTVPKHYKFKNTSILLAEDNEVNQQLMKNILTQSGIQVEIVQNGQVAVDNIQQALENNNPLYDLILMDIQMPVLDGFSASVAIRKLVEDYQKHEIPIIAITAHTSVHSREKCLRSGMVDFMPKPIDPETCLEVLSQWIHSDKISLAQTNPFCFEQNPLDSMKYQIPEINMKMGLKRAAGNEVLFKKMLLEFFNEYQNIVDHLENLTRNGKRDELKVMAHTLKGLGGNIGAENLHRNAFLLEQAIKQNIEVDIHASFTNLVQTIARLLQGIKQNVEWLSQTDKKDILSTNIDVNTLKKAFETLDALLENGRTTAIDAFYELVSQIPDFLQTESKHLESLILSYDFENAQTCLHSLIDRMSLK